MNVRLSNEVSTLQWPNDRCVLALCKHNV